MSFESAKTMEELSMVIAGDWVCGPGNKWDFVVDKKQMARLVPVNEGMCLADLEARVLREYKLDDAGFTAKLSYWPPTSLELATGITTPPVLLTSDAAIRYFLQHLRVKGAMNLFVRFEKVLTQSNNDNIDDSGMGFVTHAAPKQRIPSSAPGGYKHTTPHGGVFGLKKQMFSTGGPVMSKRRCVSEAPPVNLDDVEFVREAEILEEELEAGGKDSIEGAVSGGSEAEDEVTGEEVDELDIRPRGYDKDFWSPLLSGDYGGSNAVNVIYNEDEIVDGMLKRGGPRYYASNGSERVPSTVEVGGPSGGFPGNNEEANRQAWTGGGVDGEARPRTRNLEDVDDEEFDIPPLFDDTTYESSEIPDMDATEDDGQIYVGKVYANKEDCQISLAIYAIKKQFRFKQTTTKIDSFVVQCPDLSCDWRVLAREVRGTGYYEIRKAQLDHSCPIDFRMGYKSRATSKVIAAVYKSRFGAPGKGPVPRELQRLLLEDLKVSASYMKCYRAQQKAQLGVFGSEEDSYMKLPEYLHMLKLANPGTVADIETETDEDGDERFLYLFLAFGASIVGFRKLRLVLVIDGTHLGGKYKGVLLTASGQDANFQIFPLAYAVVDSEDEDAWTWFLQKLERILGDSPRLAIISDRATCIATAVKRVYPRAHHGYCIVHLARNVNSRYSSKGLAKTVVACATAYRPAHYKDQYAKIRATNSDCGVYLGNIGVAHWSRVNFQADRYNIMTSNIAEQLNKALVEGRTLPVKELVIFIQRMMTRWFRARRAKAEKHRGLVSIEVDKELTKNMAYVSGSKINSSTDWRCEIINKFGRSDRVLLDEKQCSCKYFDKIKIPCGHAIMAANHLGVPYDTLVGSCYKTTTWRETYAGVISPHGDPRDVEIPEEVKKIVLLPPTTRRLAGRRRKNRIPSTGDFHVGRKKKEIRNRCTRCRQEGHNRTRCTVPI